MAADWVPRARGSRHQLASASPPAPDPICRSICPTESWLEHLQALPAQSRGEPLMAWRRVADTQLKHEGLSLQRESAYFRDNLRQSHSLTPKREGCRSGTMGPEVIWKLAKTCPLESPGRRICRCIPPAKERACISPVSWRGYRLHDQPHGPSRNNHHRLGCLLQF